MTPEDLIEAAAKAIEDAEFGYSLNLTRLVDNESTYVLTYTDGSEPLEFSDIDEAYEHIAYKRETARARAAASIFIEACAKEADAASAMREQLFQENGASLNASKAVQAQEIATAIRALGKGE
jgi:hypothetical protein